MPRRLSFLNQRRTGGKAWAERRRDEAWADYNLARMSGMLDLSRDETATCPVKRHGMVEDRGFLDHRGAVFRP